MNIKTNSTVPQTRAKRDQKLKRNVIRSSNFDFFFIGQIRQFSPITCDYFLPTSWIPLLCHCVVLACFLSCLHQPSLLPSPPSMWSGAVNQLWSAPILPPFAPYLRQPAVLVRAVSHSRCLGLQFSSPPPPLLPRSQPERGTITSSERACSAWSTISIFTESWDDRFHNVPETVDF